MPNDAAKPNATKGTTQNGKATSHVRHGHSIAEMTTSSMPTVGDRLNRDRSQPQTARHPAQTHLPKHGTSHQPPKQPKPSRSTAARHRTKDLEKTNMQSKTVLAGVPNPQPKQKKQRLETKTRQNCHHDSDPQGLELSKLPCNELPHDHCSWPETHGQIQLKCTNARRSAQSKRKGAMQPDARRWQPVSSAKMHPQPPRPEWTHQPPLKAQNEPAAASRTGKTVRPSPTRRQNKDRLLPNTTKCFRENPPEPVS